MNAHIQTGHFHDADDLLEKALDALDEQATAAPATATGSVMLAALQASPNTENDLTPPRAQTVFEQGLGLFSSPEDAVLIDEVVSIAYADRRRPSREQPLVL